MTKKLLPLSPGLKLSCRLFPPLPSSLLYLEKAANTTGLGLQLLALSLSTFSKGQVPHNGKNTGSPVQEAWIYVPTLSLLSTVTLDKRVNIFNFRSPICKMGIKELLSRAYTMIKWHDVGRGVSDMICI